MFVRSDGVATLSTQPKAIQNLLDLSSTSNLVLGVGSDGAAVSRVISNTTHPDLELQRGLLQFGQQQPVINGGILRCDYERLSMFS